MDDGKDIQEIIAEVDSNNVSLEHSHFYQLILIIIIFM